MKITTIGIDLGRWCTDGQSYAIVVLNFQDTDVCHTNITPESATTYPKLNSPSPTGLNTRMVSDNVAA